MNLLNIWLGTIICSIACNVNGGLNMIKDLADQGYKINIEQLSETEDQFSLEEDKISKLGLFVPFVNILLEFDKKQKYNQAKPYLVDQLRAMGCLEHFSKEEKEAYELNPTGLNALLIYLKARKNETDELLLEKEAQLAKLEALMQEEDARHNITMNALRERTDTIAALNAALANGEKISFTIEEYLDFVNDMYVPETISTGLSLEERRERLDQSHEILSKAVEKLPEELLPYPIIDIKPYVRKREISSAE